MENHSEKQAKQSRALPQAELEKANVLIIEDEVLMSSLIHRYVKALGKENGESFRVKCLDSGWDMITQDLSHIDVAVIDILLPQITGVDLIKDFQKRFPELGIVAVTGMATEPMKREVLQWIPKSQLLQKPLRKEAFYKAFMEAKNKSINNMEPTGPSLNEEADEELWAVSVSQFRADEELPTVRRKKLRKKSA